MKIQTVLLLTTVLLVALSACAASGTSPDSTTLAGNENPVQQSTATETTASPSTAANTPAGEYTREQAIQIALQHAGLTQDAVRELETEKGWEQGKLVWDVDFDHSTWEYSYHIDPQTGEILKSEKTPD